MHTQDAPSWIWSPLPGQVRWSTVAACTAAFLLVTWRGGMPGEAWWMRPARGMVAAMAALCGFEILYQATGAVVHRWSLGSLTFTAAGTGGWLVGYAALRMRPNWWLLGAFVILWLVWVATGFMSNMPDRIIPGAEYHWSWATELLNVGSKTLLAACVTAGAVGLAHRHVHQRREGGAPVRSRTASSTPVDVRSDRCGARVGVGPRPLQRPLDQLRRLRP